MTRHLLRILALAVLVPIALVDPAAAAIAPSTAALPVVGYDHCSWNRPGVNPFMGDVVAAVDRYRDIPPEIRERLKARMAKREYDDLVSIRRDAIVGRGGYDYGNGISDMHFGTNQVCRTVTRAAWTPEMEERGLVYCESGQCILVPTICRNVSRIARRGVGNEVAHGLPPFLPPGAGLPGADDAAGAIEPLAALVPTVVPPLDAFAATAAGLRPDGGPIGQGPYLGSFAALAPAVGGGFAGGSVGGGGGGGGGGGTGTGTGGTSSATGTSNAAGTGTPGTASTGSTTDTTTDPRAPTGVASLGPVPGREGSSGAIVPAVVGAVPEPQTWALMLGGGGLLMLAARRRRVGLATVSGR